MKILYLTIDDVNSPLGQSQILQYQEKICQKNSEVVFAVVYLRNQSSEPQIATHSRIKLIPILRKAGMLGIFISYFRFYSKIKQLVRSNQVDLIHTRSYLPRLIIWLFFNQKTQAKTLFDTRGFWFDERLDFATSFFQKTFLKTLKNWSERKMYASSRGIVMLSEASKQIISRRWKELNPENIRVIYCSSDANKFDGLKETSNEKYILFAGSLGRYYMLDEMLEFFAVLKKKYNQLSFYLVSQECEKAQQRIKELGLESQSIKCFSARYDEIPALTKNAIAGLFFIRPTFAKQASFPTKLSEFILAEKPVIFNSGIGDLDELNASKKFGYSLKSFDMVYYRETVEKIELSSTGFEDNFSFAEFKSIVDSTFTSDLYLAFYKEIIDVQSER